MTTTYQKTIRVILRSMAIFLAMLCISVSSADAHTISVEEAKAKAQRFLSKNSENPEWRARGASAAPAFKLAYESKTTDKSASCFYVLSHPSAGGYIIMSADDRLPEVLGYSDNGEFDINQIPDNMKWWLSEYERQIEQVLTSANGDAVSTDETAHRAGWTAIEPLVKTKWNQRIPYYNLCPTINGQSCLTGCTATAMAQIMNYHQWPVTGRGSHSYEWNGQTLSMDFSKVTFDWANMKEEYWRGQGYSPEEGNAVATLMYACGISIDMNYDLEGSGAYPYSVFEALYDYFDYDADYLERNAVKLPDWESLIYNELVNKRPVLYCGSSYGGLGLHAMVCDGYSSDGLFHINWGWGGSEDGYFLLNILDPFEGEKTDNQSIVYGISPISEEDMDDAIKNGITINAENFPDDNFRNYLLEHKYGKDGVLTKVEIKRMEFSPNNRSISTLKGIEYLTDLTSLDCSSNQLTTLDVSNNTALTHLYCFNNQLTALDVSNNTALIGLDCPSNQLTTLDVSNNTALTHLSCYNNQLTALDIFNNKTLRSLNCRNNQLRALDISNNKDLSTLYCENNQLTALDVSNNKDLYQLYCSGNQLTALDVSNKKELYTLYCSNNQLTALDVSNNKALRHLEFKNNPLTSFNCSRSNFKGEGMDKIIDMLPKNTTNETYSFFVYDDTHYDEGNICTKAQVAALKAKGWTPYYYCDNSWKEYEGAELEDILLAKKADAEATYKTAKEVYEQYMYYYEVYQQAEESQTDNRGQADEILTDIEALEKKISESGLTEATMAAFLATLDEVEAATSALAAESSGLLSDNAFYANVQEYYKQYVSAYNDRLTQYAMRIEAATTVEELNTLTAEIGQDAEETKMQYLNPVISDYDGLDLENTTARLAQIGEELNLCKTRLQSCAAKVAYKMAAEVYEQYMYYYEGEGMSAYQQVAQAQAEAQADNQGKADEILTNVEGLEKTISESGLTEGEKTANLAVLSGIRSALSSLTADNDSLLSSNPFYTSVQEYYEKYITAYNDRLIQYAARIEAASTIDELNALIAEMEQDAEETKTQYLNPVISNYDGLEQITTRLAQISEKLDGLKTKYQSCADRVEAAIEKIEIAFSKKKDEAKTVHETAMEVYERYMYYYEGEGMSAYQQVVQAQVDNHTEAENLLTDIEALIKTVVESGMTRTEKLSYRTALNDIKASTSALSVENDGLFSANSFYAHVQEYYEKYVSAYNDRLVQYATRIEAATTAEELNTLIAEIEQDAGKMKRQYLNPVIIDYDGLALEKTTARLAQIGEELEGLKTLFLSYADEVEAIITGVPIVKADAKHVIVYTIGGRRQVMKKSELKLLPKGLYIINGKKVWMK